VYREPAPLGALMAGAIDIVLPGESPGAPPVSVKKLVAGQYFGELALFDDKPRSATAIALTDTHAMELTREDLTKAMAESPTAAMTVLREMADRLRECCSPSGPRKTP
jgi:CRP/FNR family transcriptional regulator, cyclic AMP receptor protein